MRTSRISLASAVRCKPADATAHAAIARV